MTTSRASTEKTRPAEAGGMHWDHNNPVRINHVGFLPHARKAFVIEDPQADTFQVLQGSMRDRTFHVVHEAALQPRSSELPGRWVGDLTRLDTQANYRITCGEQRSRPFVVSERIYDVPCRVLLNFFQWQRCGHPQGWAGPCHLDDGVIKETGQHLDLSGGHHQSCDLRKSIDGVSIGFMGLIRYALLEAPHWDDGCLAGEIKWSCDYFRKLIHPAGFMRDGLFLEVDHDWGARYFHDTPAAPSEQWHAISLQALAARYFREKGLHDHAEPCLDAARRIWRFMTSDTRPPGPYQTPIPPPYGLTHINRFYTGVYKDSAADLSFRVCAAAELYRATGATEFLDEVATGADRFCALQVDSREVADNPAAGCFREAAESHKLAGNRANYAWGTAGPMCLCEALDLLPAHAGADAWRESLRKVTEQHTLCAGRNVWQRTPGLWLNEEEKESLEWITRKMENPDFLPGGTMQSHDRDIKCFYVYGNRNGTIVSHGLLLARAAALLEKPDLLGLAQSQIDWIMGANPYDASCITGVGYNQFTIPMWALFPPIPQIPGGVTVGMRSAEYEIPVAGQLMWLLAEMHQACRSVAKPTKAPATTPGTEDTPCTKDS